MANEIIEVLMSRDGISFEEALEQAEACKEAVLNGDEEALMLMLGLEDDYLFDLFDLGLGVIYE